MHNLILLSSDGHINRDDELIIYKGYSVIVTTSLAHKSRRGIKENPITKIREKKVRVVGLTSYMRLTPPPPKDAPVANQKLFTEACLGNEIII